MTIVNRFKVKDMVLTAMFAALLCVIAPFSIPVGPISITLATFAVYLAPSVLGWRRGTLAVLLYILLGAVGLPVFSGFMGGAQRLIGPTGGYLIGYLPCAAITGIVTCALKNRVWANVLGMVIGTVVLYTLGTAWFMVQSGATLAGALMLCAVPFLPGDAIKVILTAVIAPPLRSAALR